MTAGANFPLLVPVPAQAVSDAGRLRDAPANCVSNCPDGGASLWPVARFAKGQLDIVSACPRFRRCCLNKLQSGRVGAP